MTTMQRSTRSLVRSLSLATLIAAGALGGGGCGSDLCEGLSQACLSVRLEADGSNRSDRLRVLLGLDGATPVERISRPPLGMGEAQSFPIAFSVLLGDRGGSAALDVIAELAGSPVLRGTGTQTVAAGEHKSLTIKLTGDTGDATRSNGGTPAARTDAAMAYFPERRSVILFGGTDSSGKALDDTWEFDGNARQWRQLSVASHPSARTTTLAYHARRHSVALFGGIGADGTAQSDLWVLDQTGAWSKIAQPSTPPARGGAALAYDLRVDSLLMYGGTTGTQPLSDLWELPGDSNTWNLRTLGMPVPVVLKPRMVYDGRYVLLIGSDEASPVDIRVWRLESMWTAMPPPAGNTPPSRRTDFALSYDLKNDAVILFGGNAAGTAMNDTYAWNPLDSRWTLLGAAGTPTARSRAAMAYVPELGGSFLTTGSAGDGTALPSSDAWLLTSRSWNTVQ